MPNRRMEEKGGRELEKERGEGTKTGGEKGGRKWRGENEKTRVAVGYISHFP